MNLFHEINFNAEETVNRDFMFNLFEDDYNLKQKLNNDMQNCGSQVDYKHLINLYNQNVNLNFILLNKDGVLMSISNILEKLDWDSPDRTSNYLKNLCDLLTLKHLLFTIEKTKILVSQKINSYKKEANSQINQKYKYTELLKKNIELLFNNNETNKKLEENFNKIRPLSAHGRGNSLNIFLIDSNNLIIWQKI